MSSTIRRVRSSSHMLPVASDPHLDSLGAAKPVERRAWIQAGFMVACLVCILYTLSMVNNLGSRAKDTTLSPEYASTIGTGEGEGLEVLWDKHEAHTAHVSPAAGKGQAAAKDAASEGGTHAISKADDSAVVPDPEDGQGHTEHHKAAHVAAGAHHSKVAGLYSLIARDAHGVEVPLTIYTGHVALVVNVASHCGYTDNNYKGLMEVYEKYQPFGLEIMAFPCNAFGQQEPGTMDEIVQFCHDKYNVSFPIFDKVEVNGETAHPVYKFLRRHAPQADGGGGGAHDGAEIRWNFEKFLVDQQGRPVRWYKSQFDRFAIERDVYALLTGAELAPR